METPGQPPPTPPTAPPPRVRVGVETHTAHGWEYEIAVTTGGAEVTHVVSLGWRDHDYWCGGSLAPSRVVRAVVEYLVARGVDLPAKFDAARARYLAPKIDQELRETM